MLSEYKEIKSEEIGIYKEYSFKINTMINTFMVTVYNGYEYDDGEYEYKPSYFVSLIECTGNEEDFSFDRATYNENEKKLNKKSFLYLMERYMKWLFLDDSKNAEVIYLIEVIMKGLTEWVYKYYKEEEFKKWYITNMGI